MSSGAPPAGPGQSQQDARRSAAGTFDPFPSAGRKDAGRMLWRVVQATLFRLSMPRAHRWRRALLRAFGAKIGRNVRLHPRCRVAHPALFEMGDWSSLGDGATVANPAPVRIGAHTGVSQGVFLAADPPPYGSVRIGSGVWLAAQAFVGPGVTVGDNAVVGARAVVVTDLPPGVIAAGDPARVLKPRPMPAPPAP